MIAPNRGTITPLHTWGSKWLSPHNINTGVKKRPDSPFKFLEVNPPVDRIAWDHCTLKRYFINLFPCLKFIIFQSIHKFVWSFHQWSVQFVSFRTCWNISIYFQFHARCHSLVLHDRQISKGIIDHWLYFKISVKYFYFRKRNYWPLILVENFC